MQRSTNEIQNTTMIRQEQLAFSFDFFLGGGDSFPLASRGNISSLLGKYKRWTQLPGLKTEANMEVL